MLKTIGISVWRKYHYERMSVRSGTREMSSPVPFAVCSAPSCLESCTQAGLLSARPPTPTVTPQNYLLPRQCLFNF